MIYNILLAYFIVSLILTAAVIFLNKDEEITFGYVMMSVLFIPIVVIIYLIRRGNKKGNNAEDNKKSIPSEKKEDRLIITYDNYNEDLPVLMISRQTRNSCGDVYTQVLNTFTGDKAIELYMEIILSK
jgi:uncharacterized membrane protein